jgi:hypothetical protein
VDHGLEDPTPNEARERLAQAQRLVDEVKGRLGSRDVSGA